jgi:virginiamycin A acetyltransferase
VIFLLKRLIGHYKRKIFWDKEIRQKHLVISYKVVLKNVVFDDYSQVAHHARIFDSTIGKRTSIGVYSAIHNSIIGAYCSISWNVTVGAVAHPVNNVSSHAFLYQKDFGIVDRDTKRKQTTTYIGNDVWIGCGATIISGVRVGNGAIIGAGAVVTKDIEPYSIVGGVPAKIIRCRFDENIRKALEESQWWLLPDNVIKQNLDIFSFEVNKDTAERLLKLGLNYLGNNQVNKV